MTKLDWWVTISVLFAGATAVTTAEILYTGGYTHWWVPAGAAICSFGAAAAASLYSHDPRWDEDERR